MLTEVQFFLHLPLFLDMTHQLSQQCMDTLNVILEAKLHGMDGAVSRLLMFSEYACINKL